MRLATLTLAAASVLLCPLAVHADTTYSYVGNPVNYIHPSPDDAPLLTIRGSFTVASPFAPDSGGLFTPESFSFSDGLETISTLFSADYFDVTTDASGNVFSWGIELYDSLSGSPSTSGPSISTVCFGGSDIGDRVQYDYGSPGYIEAGNSFYQGTWTETTTGSPVPEPSTLILLGSGVLTLAGAIRRRRA